ncbi:MAG: histidinol-phosphate transaminase [Candidatus Altiarchaeota archaeon]
MIKPKEQISGMKPYCPPIEGRAKFKHRYDFNESTIGCHPNVVKDVVKFVKEGRLHVYPEYGDLVDVSAGYFGVKPGQVMVTNGSDQGIDIIVRAYVEKGDEVVIPTPSFAMFYQAAQVEGADIRKVLYNEDLSFPTERVLDAICEKTALVILCNPNNPTGTPIARGDIVRILEKAKDVPVYVDETYFEFSRESAVDLVGIYDNLVITRTFSKAFGLAALRAGFVISDERNIRELMKVRGPYDVNMIAKTAIVSAIRNRRPVEKYARQVMEESRPLMIAGLENMGFMVYPTSANFIIVRFGDAAGDITARLGKKGVLVRDRSDYPLLGGCVRVSIGTVKDTKHFLKMLREVLR